MPYAFFHDDTPDMLETPLRVLKNHRFSLHPKKTFLPPIVFTLPFLLHTPALIAIPLFHHLLGLGAVILVGLLCRLWFTHWKFYILPLTLLTAANPFLLWYEQTVMAETIFIFCTLLLAVAGTLYALDQNKAHLGFLAGSLFLVAGARPEGKLLFGFGLFLLVLLHWRDWRAAWPRFAMLLTLALATAILTKTAQTGLLLYTSVARMTPATLKAAPGFDPYVADLRTQLQTRWQQTLDFPRVRERRLVAEAVERYLIDHGNTSEKSKRRQTGDAFCIKLARETCLHNLTALPAHVYHKFRLTSLDAPSGRLDNEWLFEKQNWAYSGDMDLATYLSQGLTGKRLETATDIKHFVDSHFQEVPWFNALQAHWLSVVNHWRFPDLRIPKPDAPRSFSVRYGVPFYFLAGALGLIVIGLRRGPLQSFHIAWGLTLLAFFFTIILTANIKPRFRLVFEPFWFIYAGLLIETVFLWLFRNAEVRRAIAASLHPAPLTPP